MTVPHIPRISLMFLKAVVVVILTNQNTVRSLEAKSSSPDADPETAAVSPGNGGLCKNDATLADMCRACAAMPVALSLPVEECCGDEEAGKLCKQCLSDPFACLSQLVDTEVDLLTSLDSDDLGKAVAVAPDDLYSDGDDDLDMYDVTPDGASDERLSEDDAMAAPEFAKRYGTLFLGKRPLDFTPMKALQADVIKRADLDDAIVPSIDSVDDVSDVQKRWGTLGLGSSNYGRYGYFGKRFGSLGTGNGKRWGTLGIGKRWGSLGIGNGKRWGSLGIGKRWGSLGIGGWKRWGSLGMGRGYRWGRSRAGKRWGTLGVGKRSGSLGSESGDETVEPEEQKRWGVLGIGKRWGSLGIGGWRKRWGLLGLSKGKRLGTLGIGKRQDALAESLGDLDDDESFGSSEEEEEEEGQGEDKRWGTLGIGKRWGTLSLEDKRMNDDLESSEDKRWGSLGIGKRWGSLGIGKRWGTLGIGKRWGTLGIGKRWGTLGIGKRWGTLGIGKRWSGLDGLGEPGEGRDPEGTRENGAEDGPAADKRYRSPLWLIKLLARRNVPPAQAARMKRWGTLNLGKRRGSVVAGVDPGGMVGPGGLAGPQTADKRWGTLFLGKREAPSENEGENSPLEGSWGAADKKWGSLGIGKKWGSLGIGKKWGSLGIGKK